MEHPCQSTISQNTFSLVIDYGLMKLSTLSSIYICPNIGGQWHSYSSLAKMLTSIELMKSHKDLIKTLSHSEDPHTLATNSNQEDRSSIFGKMLKILRQKPSIQVSVNTSNLISAKISTGSWQDADVRYRQCHTSSMLEIPSHSKTPPSKVFDSEIKLALIQCSNAVRTQIPKSIESMQKI
eukprot:gene1698-4822_t